MINVFLSASIPLPGRDERYLRSVDLTLVREAIRALVVSLIEIRGHLVFGGHPAITPMLGTLYEDFGYSPREMVTLYQTEYYRKVFPRENSKFGRVVVTPDVGDREQSLSLMRSRMLTDAPIQKGVFVAGMDGVVEEFHKFVEIYGLEAALPLSSTGGAAKVIFDENLSIRRSIGTELTYLSLFREEFSNLRRS